ncbi:PREDICTED: sulfhydryl oxidase 1-like [Ceratosolen solmsi marchali]|uniref:Sulfhydryl oxidase n=1 Tax=Ceratosolen solmsi marchali TaxID=326594 RepID=A0AAJ6YFC4_9HYME|nr:PREDICTED: sulfhydryl oxidase 1-like [Ceratosolen solmsi marchali]
MEKQQQLLLEMLISYIILVLLVAVYGVSSTAVGQNDEETDLGENQGLYSANDLVIILNENNFKSSVYNSKRAWFVEFYNSWCGFCQRFAPVWKSLAKNIHGWKQIVSIAAINCANDDNNPLCREYEIMKYPTLKFFPINSNPDFLGLEIQEDKDEILSMQRLIDQLEKEQQEQRGGLRWPNIVPYRGTELDTLWLGAPRNVEYEILIFEKPNSYLGTEVILDLHRVDTIRIRRVTSENEFLCVTSKVTKFPSVLIFDRNKSQTFLKINAITRIGIREAILEFLKFKKVSADIGEDSIDERDEQYASKIIKNKSLAKEFNVKDKLYQLDLENTLYYSLNNEIPLSVNISGEKLKALKTYLNVLIEYFPVYLTKGKIYLQVLKEVVENKSNISGKEFREQVQVKEKKFTLANSGLKNWIGCKGSTPNFRGYPCGLWTLFHTLTTAAAEEIDDVHNNNLPVLQVIHGYVQNFFGCTDCVTHFQDMSKKRKLFEVHGGNESILWLWKAHNEVNERLTGDTTEDPEHKKIQYPSVENCPKCKLSNDKWDENEVLKYLKIKYSKTNIDFQGINDKLVQHKIDTIVLDSSLNHNKLSWDFTIFDISICVVLYIISAGILILVCIKFAFKKSHKKKILFQKLFGLV